MNKGSVEIKGISRTLVVGDTHGGHKALVQCLERSKFDKENDRLIVLGDVVDGWEETPEVIEELLTIKNLILIKGNHDHWAQDFLQYGAQPDVWLLQGGQATKNAYLRRPELIEKHGKVLQYAPYYFIDEENRIYCHGGFERGEDIRDQMPQTIMWDRTLATRAVNSLGKPFEIKEYKEVYLGHTTVNSFARALPENLPIISGNVILLDTGGGWEGVVTIMDVSTHEYWQSDIVASLYPGVKGRGNKY